MPVVVLAGSACVRSVVWSAGTLQTQGSVFSKASSRSVQRFECSTHMAIMNIPPADSGMTATRCQQQPSLERQGLSVISVSICQTQVEHLVIHF